MAKQLLPWFGGGSIVWAACLLFFQVALVGGYAYAHVTRRLGLPRQAWLHVGTLGIALVFLPILVSVGWKPVDGTAPVARVVLALAATIGVPFVLLAATAPLMQDWFTRVFPGRSPYRLYVVSNVGSLAALVVYPLLVEPNLTMPAQAVWWSIGFGVFGLVTLWCAWPARHASKGSDPSLWKTPATGLSGDVAGVSHREGSDPLDAGLSGDVAGVSRREGSDPFDRVLWIALPAIGSALLVATTNALTQDVAAVPLLWVVPLSIYLLTFIGAFGGLYWRWAWGPALIVLIGTLVLAANDSSDAVLLEGAALLAAFAAAGMVCHGELAETRPAPSHLTAFYLAISIGGSLGTAFVTLVAPLAFTSYVELPLLFLIALGALLAVTCRSIARGSSRYVSAIAVLVAVAAFAGAGWFLLHSEPVEGLVAQDRGFYGVLRVSDEGSNSRRQRKLWHGRIIHGVEALPPSPIAGKAGSYYAPDSGIALAVGRHPKRARLEPIKIGVVGLGSGTVAALGQPFDQIRFFELDPLVVEFSNRYFSYLKSSAARTQIVLGDARLSLEREMVSEQNRHTYDVLAIDAFSGDAIPVHLITREAFALYRQALSPNGILAVHVSNRYLDLKPVVRASASIVGREMLQVEQGSGGPYDAIGNTWLLITSSDEFIEIARPLAATELEDTRTVAWTDAFSSLISVWKSPG